jgi:alkylation response protein AidB-like acyl-CoA dehydrogenase
LFGPDSIRTGTDRHGALGSIEAYFTAFGSTISAGSSEIQRNIIAERVLGLPRG